jgi:ABC-type cobalamin/Fe3+-siderophores transport system ATPase subunit
VTLEEGTVHCLVGENGCGKSTLIEDHRRGLPTDSGTVGFGGTLYKSVCTDRLNPGGDRR